MSVDELELRKILSEKINKAVTPNKPRASMYPYDEEEEDLKFSNFSQWTSTDDTNFLPAGKTFDALQPGLYEPKYSSNSGYFLQKLHCSTDGLLKFPETNSEKVLLEIQKFWEKEDLFKAHRLTYKRGIMLWGPPGSGKSSTIKLILKDIIDRKGIAVKFNVPNIFVECVRIIRSIQSHVPLLVLLEDIDSIISEFGETDVLNILDGVESVNKVVYLATTNYPEELGERIINRPSRFDRRFKMPHPGKESRRLYLKHLIDQESSLEKKIDLDRWVDDTVDMSVAHLKELFIAVCILGDPYEDVIEMLKSMNEDKISSAQDEHGMGFMPYKED